MAARFSVDVEIPEVCDWCGNRRKLTVVTFGTKKKDGTFVRGFTSYKVCKVCSRKTVVALTEINDKKLETQEFVVD